jgi:biopolymer transport protein ExbD
MSLRKKKGSDDKIEIPMSSMIDVVFLLLIYFIVTYKEELPEAHLQVNLPSPSQSQSKEPPQPPLEIEVHPRHFYFRSMPLPPATIKRALSSLAASDPEITVVIKTNVAAPMKNLIEILDICKAVNLKNLNVMTIE